MKKIKFFFKNPLLKIGEGKFPPLVVQKTKEEKIKKVKKKRKRQQKK